MKKCINPEVGKLIHAYELKKLSKEDNENFELHLLDCEKCFNEIKQMEKISDLLAHDTDTRRAFKESQIEAASGTSFWIKLKNLLFPETNWFAKPALIYLALLLLIYPAYRGLSTDDEQRIRSVISINLIPDRSAEAVGTLDNKDILIRIIFPEAKPGIGYSISILSAKNDTVYFDDNFKEFDNYGTALLLVPEGVLKSGKYKVIIKDTQKITGGFERQYQFTIEE